MTVLKYVDYEIAILLNITPSKLGTWSDAVKLGEMTVSGALRALGKLEGQLTGEIKPKSEAQTGKAAVADISKAPAPISPLRGSDNQTGYILTGSDEVPAGWTYDKWKADMKAGRIKRN